MESNGSKAKLKHVQACLLDASQYVKSAGFDQIELGHEAMAGLALGDICTKLSFLGHELKVPLMIAPMTGGMELGALLNERWAKAAEHFGLAFGVGSQRLALEDPRVRPSFWVRKYAKNALIFANLGAAQLVQNMNAEHALAAVFMIEANALFIHLNPMQEACKSNGDTNFVGILKAIEQVVERLHREKIPVLVREVGFGLSQKAARDLINTGIAGLDCAGAGGTSWTKVEALCSSNIYCQRLALLFGEWGIKTTTSISNVRAVSELIPLIASGGLRSGLDIAKALVLGANLGAMAQPMLKSAIESEEALFMFIEQVIHELRIAMLGLGAGSLDELKLRRLR